MKDKKQSLKFILGVIETLSVMFILFYSVLSFSGVTSYLREIAIGVSLLISTISLFSKTIRDSLLKGTLWFASVKVLVLFSLALMYWKKG